MILYDTKHSLFFDDYLDLLLNKDQDFCVDDDVTSENGFVKYRAVTKEKGRAMDWNMATKLEKFEYIRFSEQCAEPDDRDKIPKEYRYIYTGGLRLPEKDSHEGSGNIVIIGHPGAGKSTLAFQIAAMCTSTINKGISIYYSLEVPPKNMLANMTYPDSRLITKPLFYVPGSTELDNLSSQNLCKRLTSILQDKNSGSIVPQILLPSMSPRGISAVDNANSLFLSRYEELELMLKAVSKYNESAKDENNPLIKSVVVDSLNAFGNNPLGREELYRLFDLFHHYAILGIFTLEESSTRHTSLDVETIKYMADVVISLKKDYVNDYTCQYIEIEKSRYTSHVIGNHPYKISEQKLKDSKSNSTNDPDLRKRLEILPSLHYRIYGSESRSFVYQGMQKVSQKDNLFGINEMNYVLPNHVVGRNPDVPQIISIYGDTGIYKSDLAINSLLHGIVNKNESGLIIRMGDRPVFLFNGARLNKGVFDSLQEKLKITSNGKPENSKLFSINLFEDEKLKELPHSEHKYSANGWYFHTNKNGARLIEISFKSGALLPEEFIEEVCGIIKKFDIRRVVFTDVKSLGVSYPFLVKSSTSGEIFLPAFVHLMRNYRVHVVMSCTQSDLTASNQESSKASVLSDAVISCSLDDNKSERKVSLFGEGLVTNNKQAKIRTNGDKKCRFVFYSGEDPICASPFLHPFEISIV